MNISHKKRHLQDRRLWGDIWNPVQLQEHTSHCGPETQTPGRTLGSRHLEKARGDQQQAPTQGPHIFMFFSGGGDRPTRSFEQTTRLSSREQVTLLSRNWGFRRGYKVVVRGSSQNRKERERDAGIGEVPSPNCAPMKRERFVIGLN